MAIETFDTLVDNYFSGLSRADILFRAQSLNLIRSSYSLLKKSKDFDELGSEPLTT